MTTIKRDQFLGDFKRDGNYVEIDVNKLDQGTLEKLKDAGISKKDLANVAGSDGKISDEAEYNKLFNQVDVLEKDKEKDSFESMTHVTYVGSFYTKSGAAHEALKQEVDRNLNIARAQGVLTSSPTVANTDPHAKHVAQVQKDLKDKGLPTSAKGVNVLIMGDEPDHGAAVTRTIAGKTGLAKDANVQFQKSGNFQTPYVDNHRYTKALPENVAEWTAKDYAKLGIVQSEASVHAAREEIGAARKNHPSNGQTRIGNMSWGKSPARIAEEWAMSAPTNSKAFQDAVTSVEAKSRGVRFDPNNQNHVNRARLELAKTISDDMKTLQSDKDNQKTFKSLKDGLEWEVKEARKDGLLIFNSAGNERVQANVLGDENLSTLYTDSVKGMITVGAADASKVGKAGANPMWDGSAKGSSIEIAAPGVDLPVGVSGSSPAMMTGTSFASPYAASVAALMVAANPKITPDQIEQILTSGRVTTDLPGDRDGKGYLDPVKAVQEAKDLAKPAKK